MTLYEQVCDEANLLAAWEHVKAGGKRGGTMTSLWRRRNAKSSSSPGFGAT